MKQLVLLIAGFFLLAGVSMPAQSGAPSLADVAKQNRDRESKDKKKPVLVLNEDDFPASSLSQPDDRGPASKAATPANSAKSSEPGSSSAEQGTKKDNDSGEKSDAQIAELKKKVDSYTAERDSWKKVAKDYENRLANETDDFRRQMYEDALENDHKNAALYQKKIDEAQSELNQAQQAAAKQASQHQGETGSENSQ